MDLMRDREIVIAIVININRLFYQNIRRLEDVD